MSSGLPCIIYPARDESDLATVFRRDQRNCIEEHTDTVIRENATLLEKANYTIIFAWNIDKQPILDIWMFQLENKTESGPLVIALTFKDSAWVKDMGTTSGDGLIVLGYEEILRRHSASFDAYFNIPDRHSSLPDICRADEAFYQ